MSENHSDRNDGAQALLPNHVHANDGCPMCDQTDVDHLLIDTETEEHVTCLSCGHRYELQTEPAPVTMAN